MTGMGITSDSRVFLHNFKFIYLVDKVVLPHQPPEQILFIPCRAVTSVKADVKNGLFHIGPDAVSSVARVKELSQLTSLRWPESFESAVVAPRGQRC